MGTNLHNFNASLEAASERIHKNFNNFHKKVIFETLKRIVMRTPVDTGRARGNWQLAIGGAAQGTLDVKGGSGQMAAKALKNAADKLSSITPYSLVHLTNNVEYVYYLEYDRRSEQHPEGMVEITLTEMAAWLFGVKRENLSFLKE